MASGLRSFSSPPFYRPPKLRLPFSFVDKIPDMLSSYWGFKYRLWFTWYISCSGLKESGIVRSPWWAVICGTDASGDLWLWEDDDEECIKEFADGIPHSLVMPLECWDTACRALEARLSRRKMPASPLTHLAPRTRLRFIAWLIVAGPVRRDRIFRWFWQEGYRRIDPIISEWAALTLALPGAQESCSICRVSHLLPIWFETMLEIYMLEDLQSIPWDHTCSCFQRFVWIRLAS